VFCDSGAGRHPRGASFISIGRCSPGPIARHGSCSASAPTCGSVGTIRLAVGQFRRGHVLFVGQRSSSQGPQPAAGQSNQVWEGAVRRETHAPDWCTKRRCPGRNVVAGTSHPPAADPRGAIQGAVGDAKCWRPGYRGRGATGAIAMEQPGSSQVRGGPRVGS
jgi:hypothetical protein